MRVLFICTMNIDRSPTAEALVVGCQGYEARSAGTDPHARVPISGELIDWADVIAVMEDAHASAVRARFAAELAGRRLVVLQIPDIYQRGEPALVVILTERIDELLGLPKA